ncbi:uncharacterized protein LOC115441074 [Manduca sexta]|uniref:Chloride channel CLIC-like protein 1 n=1 Tax=Manduca sexta TaxID=7130 RepID=A0A921YVM7_MANSE|nr:uncharacterized protein LOC115441074 [Manduca sexta]KAG6446442.1 hypothetical protein O3G_MSEX004431 [Manduca sexta]
MKFFSNKFTIFLCFLIYINEIESQSGPEPWNSDKDQIHVPTIRRKSSDVNTGIAVTSFKRILAIMMKSNKMKNNDGTIDVNLRMKFSPEKWSVLEEYLKPDVIYSEDMFRRTVGYVEEAIYKPTIIETMTMAWSDYVQVYLTEYKVYITWAFAMFSVLGATLWLWSHMSRTHLVIIMLLLLYIYEVAVSYKEAEQQELKRFITAVNSCKWYFWTSDCDVPSPDLLIFMKHMNPGKIAIKMFTSWISEPIICMSNTVNTIIHGITDGLWYPLDVILYGILTIIINIVLIILVIMLIFNYIFNTSYNLGFLFFNVGILQRNRAVPTAHEVQGMADPNRIGGATLDRILEICQHAIQRANINENRPAAVLPAAVAPPKNNIPRIKRSASTGRLPNHSTI